MSSWSTPQHIGGRIGDQLSLPVVVSLLLLASSINFEIARVRDSSIAWCFDACLGLVKNWLVVSVNGEPQSSPFLPLLIGQLEQPGLGIGANDEERSLLSSELPMFVKFSRVSESSLRSCTCDPAKLAHLRVCGARRSDRFNNSQSLIFATNPAGNRKPFLDVGRNHTRLRHRFLNSAIKGAT